MRTLTYLTAILPSSYSRAARLAAALAVAFLLPLFPMHAAWDGTPYEPGETLEPECAPSDPDCRVEASSLTLAGETLMSFSGPGIQVAAGALTLDRTGDWTGTFDGQEGSWYVANAFSTTSADYWRTQRDFFSTSSVQSVIAQTPGLTFSTSTNDAWLATKTTADLAEGSNLYYTDARVNALVAGSSTLAKTSASQVWTGTQSIASTLLSVTGLVDGCVELAGGHLTSTGLNCGSGGGGIISLNGLTGSGQSFATADDANVGLSITSSGGVHTFAPTWTGVLSAGRGGTGLSSVTPGSVLIGAAGNAWAQAATSTLGLPTYAALDAYLPRSAWYATTTDALDEGSVNRYYTDARVRGYLDTLDRGYFFSTTSASVFLSQNRGNAFSTTSADYWRTQRDFFSTSSVQAVISQTPGLTFSTSTNDAWLATKSTSDLAEGSRLYYTPQRFAAALAGTTTDALAEGSANRYYTDARARSALSSSIAGISYDPVSGAFSLDAGYALPLASSMAAWDAAASWGDHAQEGYITDGNDGWDNVYGLFDTDTDTTDDITEGGANRFYADARVRAYLDTMSKGYFFSTTSVDYWRSQRDFFSTSSVQSVISQTPGLTFSTSTNDAWFATKTTDLLPEGATNLYFSTARARSALSGGSGITYSTSTGSIALDRTGDWTGTFDGQEGTYYLNRANHTGTQLASTISNFTAAVASIIAGTTTDALAEGATNLYYTNARVRTYLDTLDRGYFFSTTSADYWKTQRDFFSTSSVQSIIAQTPGLTFSTSTNDAWLATKSTSDLAEGTRLYFTDARARSALSSQAPGLAYASGTGAFTLEQGYVIPLTASTSAWQSFYDAPSSRISPGTNLSWSGNTLNGPSDAYIRSRISAVGPLAYDSSTGALSLSTTGDWTGTFDGREGVYYLDRANHTGTQLAATIADFIPAVGAALAGTTTDALAEGAANRYYTDVRARSALSGGSGITYSTTTGAIVLDRTGDWSGTFDGQDGTYYLNRANHTGTQLAATIADFAAAADRRINATSTIGTLTNAPALVQVAAGLTGLLKASGGTLSSAQAGVEYEAPLSVTYPLQRSSNTISLAFGTTTNNTWSGTNTFTNGVTTNALTLGTVSGFLRATAGSVAPALVSLAGDVTGTLPVANGGTGLASVQAGRLLYGTGTGALATTTNETAGFVLQYDGAKPVWVATSTLGFSGGNAGTVTSVGLSAPAGFTVSGSPVTGSGTLAFSFAPGYGLPLTASTSAWQSFYDAPSSRISPGTNLSWSGNTLNGPSDAYIRGLFSASAPLSYNATTGAFALGTVGIANGGTGLTTTPAFGQLLMGNGSGGYMLAATSSLNLSLSSLTGTLGISQGGTGATAFSQGWIYSSGSGALAASTSPTVAWLTATSTTQASSFGMVRIGNPATYPDNPLAIQGNTNSYLQMNIQNTSSGNAASSDYIATANNGSDTSYFIDMGINGSGYSQAAFTIGGANSGYLYTSDGSLTIGTASTTNASAALIFHTGGTTANRERMRITQAGFVGIGTSTPATALDVNGDVTIESSGVRPCNGLLNALGTDSTGKLFCKTISSDERLKTGIVPLTDAEGLSLINALSPVAYTWKDPEVYGATDALQYGFIAQDAAHAAPNLVGTSSATALTPGGTYHFNYFGVIAPLVKAVQELSATVEGYAASFTTSRLCLDDVCITKDELRRLLEKADEAPAQSRIMPPPGPSPAVPEGSEAPEDPVPATAPAETPLIPTEGEPTSASALY